MDDIRKLTEIIRQDNKLYQYQTDVVVRESEVSIVINEHKVVTLACLSENLYELAVGYLFSEGLLSGTKQILQVTLSNNIAKLTVDICSKQIEDFLSNRTQVSGCGGGVSKSDSFALADDDNSITSDSYALFPFEPGTIAALMKDFQQKSHLFISTGGVHGAAIVDNERAVILSYAVDIGRHNAVDKVIGDSLIRGRDLSKCTILTTGRVSFEIINKICRLNIPVIISRSAPTSKAVSRANLRNIYLIGFARGTRFNLYSGLNEYKKLFR